MESDTDWNTTCGSVEVQPKSSQPTLRLIKETNKLVSDVKLNDTHLIIHLFSGQFQWNELAVIGCTGAGQGDRVDGDGTAQTVH